MDFRSQLSAFKSKSSDNSNRGNSGGGNNDNRDRGGRGGYQNNNNDYYNNRHGSPNRGGDRRRHRPREWGQNPNYHHGPPTARRRFNPPPQPYGSPGRGPSHGYGHEPPSLDGLGELRNLGYKIRRGFPPASTPEEKTKKPKHVALLAITIDDLPYEDIWKAWCESLSASGVEGMDDFFISVICHAKFPQEVTSEWLRQRLLTFPPKQGRGNSFMDPVFLSRTPEWGSVEITRAMLDLLQDALKIGSTAAPQYEDKRFCPSRFLARTPPSFDTEDGTIPPVDSFLYISESCLPVVTAPEFFSKIVDSGTTSSWLNARHRTESDTPKNKYEDDQFAGINRRIPGQYRWKGDQWVLLSRKHASSIIGMDRPFKPPKHQLWQSFRHINASDEMFFPTAMALLGDLRYTNEGYDTQKGRSREGESSSQTGEGSSVPASSSISVIVSPPNTADSGVGADDAAATSSPPMKNESILLKPVTYTDWTEGMKNPASYSKGVSDLKRISKIARGMGCLVARKFVTHIRIPGVATEDHKITGVITPEEWEAVIKDIQSKEKEAKQAAAVAADAVVTTVVPTVPDGIAESVPASSNIKVDTANDDSINNTASEPTTASDGKDEEDDNDDEGETQLE